MRILGVYYANKNNILLPSYDIEYLRSFWPFGKGRRDVSSSCRSFKALSLVSPPIHLSMNHSIVRLREAAKKSVFFSGPATKALIPPPLELSGTLFLVQKLVGISFCQNPFTAI